MTMNPFEKMLSDIMASQQAGMEKAVQAHTHAKEFERAINDEIASAERAGACETCVTGALQDIVIRRLVRRNNQGEVNMEMFVKNFSEMVNDLSMKIAAEVLEYRAEQIAGKVVVQNSTTIVTMV